MVTETVAGLQRAEEHLLRTQWNAAEAKLEHCLSGFATTAELRSAWQTLRRDCVKSESALKLNDFWQTHLSAETMTTTLQKAKGDLFQLLLTVLWLYTRESWLRHLVDSLAAALLAAASPACASYGSSDDGATGETPLRSPTLEGLQLGSHANSLIQPLVESLGPFLQMVQSALAWFEEQGIRHQGAAYRPLSMPMLVLQNLVERYVAVRRGHGNEEPEEESPDGSCLANGTWVTLGGGSFFSAMSSRLDALRRMSRARCNVLLVVRPSCRSPCYPKQMSLKGSAVDDVVFPLGAVFQITRVRRTVSSDLDPDIGGSGANSRWPVMIIELVAACHFLEAVETLERRRMLNDGTMEFMLQQWIDGAAYASEQARRLLSAGDVLASHSQSLITGPGVAHANSGRIEKAAAILTQAASRAEASGDGVTASKALLCLAQMRAKHSDYRQQVVADATRAINLLVKSMGTDHPQTCAARDAWRELGAPGV